MSSVHPSTQHDQQDDDDELSTRDVARLRRVPQRTVRTWIERGLLPAHRQRGTSKWWVKRSDVDRLIERVGADL